MHNSRAHMQCARGWECIGHAACSRVSDFSPFSLSAVSIWLSSLAFREQKSVILGVSFVEATCIRFCANIWVCILVQLKVTRVLLMRPQWSKRSVQGKTKSQKNLEISSNIWIFQTQIFGKCAKVFWHFGLLLYTWAKFHLGRPQLFLFTISLTS